MSTKKKFKHTEKQFCWMSDSLVEKKSPNGTGTFAKRYIRSGTLLMIFGGHVLSHTEEKKTS